MSVYADYIEASGRRLVRRANLISEGVAMAVKANEELRVQLDPSYKAESITVYVVRVADAIHGIYLNMADADREAQRFVLDGFNYVSVDKRNVV